MAEELKSLLDRIQKDGVDKAEAKAEDILAAAKAEALKITEGAKKEAQDLIAKAEKDAAAFGERGKKSLEQAARDVIITVTDAIAASFRELVSREVTQALTPAVLGELLVSVMNAYASSDRGSGKLEVLLNPEQCESVRNYFMGKYAEALAGGVEIKGDSSIVAGFRVSVVEQDVQHDFSREAVCDSICALLRPHLAEIVRTVQK